MAGTYIRRLLALALASGLTLVLLGGARTAPFAGHRWPPTRILTSRGEGLHGLAFAAETGQLVVGARGRVEVWDPETGHFIGSLRHPLRHEVGVVAVSPDERWVAAAGVPGGERLEGMWMPTVWAFDERTRLNLEDPGLWEPAPPAPGRGTWTAASRARLAHLAFSPDSAALAALSRDGTLAVWELPSGDLRWRSERVAAPYSGPIAFEARDRIAVRQVDGDLRQRSILVEDGRIRGRTHPVRVPQHGPFTRALAPDGSRMAGEGPGQALEVWDATSGRRLARYRGHPEGARALALSWDGKWLAATGWEGLELALWRLPR